MTWRVAETSEGKVALDLVEAAVGPGTYDPGVDAVSGFARAPAFDFGRAAVRFPPLEEDDTEGTRTRVDANEAVRRSLDVVRAANAARPRVDVGGVDFEKEARRTRSRRGGATATRRFRWTLARASSSSETRRTRCTTSRSTRCTTWSVRSRSFVPTRDRPRPISPPRPAERTTEYRPRRRGILLPTPARIPLSPRTRPASPPGTRRRTPRSSPRPRASAGPSRARARRRAIGRRLEVPPRASGSLRRGRAVPRPRVGGRVRVPDGERKDARGHRASGRTRRTRPRNRPHRRVVADARRGVPLPRGGFQIARAVRRGGRVRGAGGGSNLLASFADDTGTAENPHVAPGAYESAANARFDRRRRARAHRAREGSGGGDDAFDERRGGEPGDPRDASETSGGARGRRRDARRRVRERRVYSFESDESGVENSAADGPGPRAVGRRGRRGQRLVRERRRLQGRRRRARGGLRFFRRRWKKIVVRSRTDFRAGRRARGRPREGVGEGARRARAESGDRRGSGERWRPSEARRASSVDDPRPDGGERKRTKKGGVRLRRVLGDGVGSARRARGPAEGAGTTRGRARPRRGRTGRGGAPVSSERDRRDAFGVSFLYRPPLQGVLRHKHDR